MSAHQLDEAEPYFVLRGAPPNPYKARFFRERLREIDEEIAAARRYNNVFSLKIHVEEQEKILSLLTPRIISEGTPL